jgi:hypothetical protein
MPENLARPNPVICPSCRGRREYLGRETYAENKKWEIRIFRCNRCGATERYMVGEIHPSDSIMDKGPSL